MNVLELLNSFTALIKDAETKPDGGAAVRTFTIYKDIVCYLVDTDKIAFADDQKRFWAFVETYTISAMYRVANNYRRKEGLPLLEYEQPIYHNPENTVEEFRRRAV